MTRGFKGIFSCVIFIICNIYFYMIKRNFILRKFRPFNECCLMPFRIFPEFVKNCFDAFVFKSVQIKMVYGKFCRMVFVKYNKTRACYLFFDAECFRNEFYECCFTCSDFAVEAYKTSFRFNQFCKSLCQFFCVF